MERQNAVLPELQILPETYGGGTSMGMGGAAHTQSQHCPEAGPPGSGPPSGYVNINMRMCKKCNQVSRSSFVTILVICVYMLAKVSIFIF